MSVLSNTYYHQTLKSFITAFGAMFDGLRVQRWDGNNQPAQDYVVPCDYGPKNKWVMMIQERPDYITNQVQITMPRMAFEITKIEPNFTRKLGFNGSYMMGKNTDGSQTKIYNPVPYDLTIQMYSMTNNNDDNFQIVEQILPYFQPFLTMNINLLPEYNIYKDIPVSLIGVETTDSYTGAVDEQRYVMSTFTLTAPIYLFGPIASSSKVIKDVKLNFTGDVNGTLEERVSPLSAKITDVHTIIEKVTSA